MFVISTLNPEAAVCQSLVRKGLKVDDRRQAVIARRAEALEIQMVLRCFKVLLLQKMSSLSWILKSPQGLVAEQVRVRPCPDRGHRRGKDTEVKNAWNREPFDGVYLWLHDRR